MQKFAYVTLIKYFNCSLKEVCAFVYVCVWSNVCEERASKIMKIKFVVCLNEKPFLSYIYVNRVIVKPIISTIC